MSLIAMVVIAIGLSMDALAVAITTGLSLKRHLFKTALMMAIFFGGFQALMPIIGWALGNLLAVFHIEAWDHWIAFVILSFIGGKMIWESHLIEDEEEKSVHDDIPLLLGLAVATSIDALAVGISLSLLGISILRPALLIGCITFLFSFAGIYVGKKTGGLLGSKAELLGGLALIGIGIKILLDHLLH